MSEARRAVLRIVGSVSLVLGLMLFFAETRSTGEALETFKLILSSNTGSIVGAGIVLLAAAELAILHFSEHKKTAKHP